MSVYAIADLHLALSADKPMDVFGDRWSNYMERLQKNWNETVLPDDYVIVPGDVSWATYIDRAVDDFLFIEKLNGKKVISKGNHDYWWTTNNKLEKFRDENNFSSISFMHNNCFKLNNTILCGTRGWKCPGDSDFSPEDRKIYQRELNRLELSLKSAKNEYSGEIIVALHFPPFNPQGNPSDFIEIMKSYGVSTCIYGHLHGYSTKSAVQGDFDGIRFMLVSADYIDFMPVKIR